MSGCRWSTLILALVAASTSGDQARAVRLEAQRSATRPIPGGAIRVPLPTVEQQDDYSCGAAALMAVCSYFEVGPKKLERFKARLHTDEELGTNYRNIIAYGRKLGLRVDWKHDMTLAELDEHLRQGHPVICPIQAYADPCVPPEVYEDPRHNTDGHYVVAIGFDGGGYFFMDPSLGDRRGFVSRMSFDKRWHDDEGTARAPELVRHLGIAFSPREHVAPFHTEASPIE